MSLRHDSRRAGATFFQSPRRRSFLNGVQHDTRESASIGVASISLSAFGTVLAQSELQSTQTRAPRHHNPPTAQPSTGDFGAALPGLATAQTNAFINGREEFEATDDAASGLGPVFNKVSCAACHSDPATRRRKRHTGDALWPRDERLVRSDDEQGRLAPSRQGDRPARAGDASAASQRRREAQDHAALRRRSDRSDSRHGDPGERVARQAGRRPGPRGGRARRRTGTKPHRTVRMESAAGDAARIRSRCVSERDGNHESAIPDGERAERQSCAARALRPSGGSRRQRRPAHGPQRHDAFADFMRLLAPPPQLRPSRTSSAGADVFSQIGCQHCHVPSKSSPARPGP